MIYILLKTCVSGGMDSLEMSMSSKTKKGRGNVPDERRQRDIAAKPYYPQP